MEMTPLNSGQISYPVNTYNNSVTQDNPESGLVIEITPSDDNVSSGDRSQNTALINVTTPNKELSTEVSREQFFYAVQKKAYQNAYGQDTDGKLTANPYSNPELTSLAFQKSLAQTYAASYSNITSMNSYGPGYPDYGNAYSTPFANGVAAYGAAMNSYIKQTLYFSAYA